MTRFERPVQGEYSPYFKRYLDQVPADVTDINQHLKGQGLQMLNLMRSLDDEDGSFRYHEGKWSVKEVVGHLIDTERLFTFRALWIARGDTGQQLEMNQDLWAANSNAHQRRMAELWREQHVCRTDHVYLFRSMNQEAVDRRGFIGGEEVCVRAFPWLIAGHERHHLNILRDLYGIG